MKILVATSSYPVQKAPHAGIFVQRNVEELEQLGVQCTVLRPGPSEPRADVIEPAHRVVEVPIRNRHSGAFLGRGIPEEMSSRPFRTGMDVLRCTRSMTRHMRRHGREYDWILAHWAIPAGVAANRALSGGLKSTRLALWCHSSDVFALERLPLGKQIARISLKRAEHVFVPSMNLKERMGALLGDTQKIEVCHPGIKLGNAPKPLPEQPLKVLFVGRLEAIKGVEMIPELAAQNRQWEFSVVGQGALESSINGASERLGNLKVWGSLPPEKIRHQLDSHHVLLCPGPSVETRRSEGLPTVILEALASGRPVVAADTGGCAEVVDEKVGEIVPAGDLNACQKALEKLAQNPAELALKSSAARTRSEAFDSRTIAKKIKTLLF